MGKRATLSRSRVRVTKARSADPLKQQKALRVVGSCDAVTRFHSSSRQILKNGTIALAAARIAARAIGVRKGNADDRAAISASSRCICFKLTLIRFVDRNICQDFSAPQHSFLLPHRDDRKAFRRQAVSLVLEMRNSTNLLKAAICPSGSAGYERTPMSKAATNEVRKIRALFFVFLSAGTTLLAIAMMATP